MTMLEGHEGCPHDTETIAALSSSMRTVREVVICAHEHREPVRADDGLGMGPIVADYCACCGAMTTRGDWR